MRNISTRTKIFAGVGFFIVLSYGLIFALPKQVAFHYSEADCTRQLTLFPGVMKQVGDSGFAAVFDDIVTVMGRPVASLKTCFVALKAPTQGSYIVRISPLAPLFTKHYAVNVEESRVASVSDFVGKTLPTTRPLTVQLDGTDAVFNYKFSVDDKTADCIPKGTTVQCDVEKLDLAQGQTYEGTLARYFKDTKVADLGGGTFTTLRALVLGAATASEGQTIYDKPIDLTFEYDKTLALAEAELKVKNGDAFEVVPSTTMVDGKKVVVVPKEPLARNAQFELIIQKAESVDGSAIPEPYKVTFGTSGGPKVTGINVGAISVPQNGSIVITLDQEIANVDQISKLVIVEGLAAQVTKSGASLVISYANAPRCGDFKITIKKGFESKAGIVQDADWVFNGRTVCHYTQTFGYSKHGRALTAWVFGSGSKTILYTGAIHGNEQGTKTLMNAWINELEANARSIPAGVQIVVVPVVNPDGVAANSRYNANTVDLNRNFDVSDWKKDIVTPANQPLPNGGGSAPNSEPETKALVAFTQALQPHLTMSYHSTASYAIGNGCGSSASLAATYSSLSGYRNMTGVSGAFAYEITGTYDDWICEKLGRQSVLIELSINGAEFSRNKAALWAMARS